MRKPRLQLSACAKSSIALAGQRAALEITWLCANSKTEQQAGHTDVSAICSHGDTPALRVRRGLCPLLVSVGASLQRKLPAVADLAENCNRVEMEKCWRSSESKLDAFRSKIADPWLLLSSLCRCQMAEEIGQRSKAVQEQIQDLSTFGKMVKLISFLPFR